LVFLALEKEYGSTLGTRQSGFPPSSSFFLAIKEPFMVPTASASQARQRSTGAHKALDLDRSVKYLF
jgi:hypothetical protein